MSEVNPFDLRRITFPIQVIIDWDSELGMLDVFDVSEQRISSMRSIGAFTDVNVLTDATGTNQFLIKHSDSPVEGDYFYDLMAHRQNMNGNQTFNPNDFSHFMPNMALGYGKTSILDSLLEKLTYDIYRNGQLGYQIVDSNKVARLLRNAILIFDEDSDGLLPAWLSTPSFVMTNHRKQKIATIKRVVHLSKDAFVIDIPRQMISTIPVHHHALVWCALLDNCYIQAACVEAERY